MIWECTLRFTLSDPEVYPECIWGQKSEKVLKVILPPTTPRAAPSHPAKACDGRGGHPIRDTYPRDPLVSLGFLDGN